MPTLLFLRFTRATAAVMLALAAGCATQLDSSGNTAPVIDWPAIEGVRISSFHLADGSAASLRFHNDRYTVKLHRSGRIVALGDSTRVRVQETRQTQGRTLVLLDTGTRGCPHRTLVLAIDGSRIDQWDLGNCRSLPTVRVDGRRVLIEFPDSIPAMRFDYRGAQLRRQQDFGRWQVHQRVSHALLRSSS